MTNQRTRRIAVIGAACVLVVTGLTVPAQGDELWVAPTYQQDVGGLGIGSNVIWPVTPFGVVRFAFAIPDNLQTFVSATLVVIADSPGGAATLQVFTCPAQSSSGHVNTSCVGPVPHGFSSVVNEITEVDVTATVAGQVGIPGATYLALVAFTTPTQATDHIVGLRFTYEPVPPSGVATLGANTFTGTQTASAFVGDGAGLTNLPVPSGVATLGANIFTGTQTAPFFVGNGAGLTNLPVPIGVATLGANTFTGTQTIDLGNLDLDNSTATTGNLTKNGTPFLHNSGANNTFLGVGAGSFTIAGTHSTAVGANALPITTSGAQNTAVGSGALEFNTTGRYNTAVGRGALGGNSTGENNTAVGRLAGGATTGSNNTSMGQSATAGTTGNDNTSLGAFAGGTGGSGNTAVGVSATTPDGNNNTVLGFGAGGNATTGSNNIYLGAQVLGVAGESNTMYLGLQGTQTKTVIAGIRDITTVNADAVPVFIDSAGQLGTVGSSSGVATLGANTFTGTQTAPFFIGDGAGLTSVNASLLGGLTSAAFAPTVHGHDVTQVTNAATLGANTFTGTQTASAFVGDGGGLTNVPRAAPPCFDNTNRYVNCGNGTVTDTLTGLIWLQDAACLGSGTYASANDLAAALGDGQCGLTDGSQPGDWQLPSSTQWDRTTGGGPTQACRVEFDMDPAWTDDSGTGCYRNGGSSFVNVVSGDYWSSSSDVTLPNTSDMEDLSIGQIRGREPKTDTHLVWPVRGQSSW